MLDDTVMPTDGYSSRLPQGSTVQTQDIEGLEMFTLRSVGIDIGSATTHLVFSRLTLRREGAALSARYQVSERQALYRSPILLTPYRSATLIDIDSLKAFIHKAYQQAGLSADDVDTGAVIITGEALKKENAQPIAKLFAREAGKFICASAGPNHEALLAAYGSGAVALSQSKKARVMNIDVGGGTAKLSLIRSGVVKGAAALSIGSRLIAFTDDSIVTRIEEPARIILKQLSSSVEVGQRIGEETKEALADLMATVLLEIVQGGPRSTLAHELMLTEPWSERVALDCVDYIVFSGGVSEYIYDSVTPSYGDVGPQLGGCIRKYLAGLPGGCLLERPVEGIRATVIGAGEYTLQASGNTSYISSVDALPAYGLKVVRPALEENGSVAQALRAALAKFDLRRFRKGLALAISLDEGQDYQSLRRLAEGIAKMLEDADSPEATLFIVLDLDVAKSLGGILKDEFNVRQEVVAVDGIDVGDLDYVDIGRPMGISEIVPVTVKSLVFPSADTAWVNP